MTQVNTLLSKVTDPAWLRILNTKELKDTMINVYNSTEEKFVTPHSSKMFRFAEQPLDKVRVVIIGMDPYPLADAADGLAFSSPQTQKSVQRIYSALHHSNLINLSNTSSDLTHWANQGILLLNTALTTELNKSGKHLKIWTKYTNNIISKLSSQLDNLIFLLWGAEAKKRGSLINVEKHTIHTYSHPMAMVNPSFKYCDHFTLVSNIYPDIKWNYPSIVDTKLSDIDTKLSDMKLTESMYRWFTDGSCLNNQSTATSATWGFTNLPSQSKPHVYYGGSILSVINVYQDKEEKTKFTNIRAECTALIKCIQHIKDNYDINTTTHEINTDSEFWIKMINEYIPKWKRYTTFKWTDHKNADLCEQLWNVYDKSIKLNFVSSWHKSTRTKYPNNNTMQDCIIKIQQYKDNSDAIAFYGNMMAELVCISYH